MAGAEPLAGSLARLRGVVSLCVERNRKDAPRSLRMDAVMRCDWKASLRRNKALRLGDCPTISVARKAASQQSQPSQQLTKFDRHGCSLARLRAADRRERKPCIVAPLPESRCSSTSRVIVHAVASRGPRGFAASRDRAWRRVAIEFVATPRSDRYILQWFRYVRCSD